MLFRSFVLAASLIGLAATAGNAAPVQIVTFAPGSEPALVVKSARAIVYDRAGTKLYLADRDLIEKLAGPKPKIHAWNAGKSLVRITPRGPSEAWIGCEAVEQAGIACSEFEFAIGLDNDLRVSRKAASNLPGAMLKRNLRASPAAESARGLPSCPGDPRCPKL